MDATIHHFIDYATLRMIWWVLIAALLIGFAIMDGHDMGIGALLPFVGKNDEERRVIINTIGAHWEGNQVWFITGGGAIFAALPMIYATAFSGFYWAMMAVLWALFFRPVGFKYRNLMPNPLWRTAWDWGLFIGSFIPSVIFGVAFGNLLLGVPFHFNADDLRSFYTGSFWALLNPFALLCGLVSVSMIIMQGATYLMYRTVDEIYQRSKKIVGYAAIITAILFTLAGIWVAFGIKGYLITSHINPAGASNPLQKTVELIRGAWLNNYIHHPWTILIPLIGYLGIFGAWKLSMKDKPLPAFVASSFALLGIISTAGVSMFPFLMPSSSNPNSSLTIWDSTSSYHTLFIMLIATAILLPIVVTYTSWAFKVMSGKVTKEYIRENDHNVY